VYRIPTSASPLSPRPTHTTPPQGGVHPTPGSTPSSSSTTAPPLPPFHADVFETTGPAMTMLGGPPPVPSSSTSGGMTQADINKWTTLRDNFPKGLTKHPPEPNEEFLHYIRRIVPERQRESMPALVAQELAKTGPDENLFVQEMEAMFIAARSDREEQLANSDGLLGVVEDVIEVAEDVVDALDGMVDAFSLLLREQPPAPGDHFEDYLYNQGEELANRLWGSDAPRAQEIFAQLRAVFGWAVSATPPAETFDLTEKQIKTLTSGKRWKHVISGDTTTDGKAPTGLHYWAKPNPDSLLVPFGPRSKPDSNGVYLQRVRFRGDPDSTKNWKVSSFFPDTWSQDKLMHALITSKAEIQGKSTLFYEGLQLLPMGNTIFPLFTRPDGQVLERPEEILDYMNAHFPLKD
jgi:hypothetical protein